MAQSNQQSAKYEILKKQFGYDSFREGQECLIDNILAGSDVLGIMPTGAGKSLCYQVPALLFPGITLVVSPLISLMKDQVQALNEAGVHAAFINSSLSEGQILKALKLAEQGQYQIIYVAPERLETASFLHFAKSVRISMLTVDEAHCISQWGQDFRPSYLKIVEFIGELPHRPVISAFTATATQTVREDIICVLGLKRPALLVTGFDRKNLYFAVERPKKKDAAVLAYVKEHSSESGIIYCATRKNVEAVYELLLREGISVVRYHAGLGNEERRRNQEDFIYDRMPVVVATNAFGMGIDKSNVRYVLHYNMPQSLENYYQEAGRAGRDGAPGECMLFYSPKDVMINRFLLESKEQNTEAGEEDLDAIRERDEERLRTITAYCTGTECLREYILGYFGERATGACGNCSNCRQEFEHQDVTAEARQIITCLLECRQRYGINVITGILTGSNTAKLREYGVQTLSSYGCLKSSGEGRLKQIIGQLILNGVLFQTKDKYALLKLQPEAKAIFEGNRSVEIKVPKKPAISETEAFPRSRRKKTDVLDTGGYSLFEKLRELRLTIAREEKVPPYIIFSDKTLVDMCAKRPAGKEEMLEVTGVGENKFARYGERFLACLDKERTGN
ncbi:MAG: DNA helicase RecQ [Lachnospiraceae bacterium]